MNIVRRSSSWHYNINSYMKFRFSFLILHFSKKKSYHNICCFFALFTNLVNHRVWTLPIHKLFYFIFSYLNSDRRYLSRSQYLVSNNFIHKIKYRVTHNCLYIFCGHQYTKDERKEEGNDIIIHVVDLMVWTIWHSEWNYLKYEIFWNILFSWSL